MSIQLAFEKMAAQLVYHDNKRWISQWWSRVDLTNAQVLEFDSQFFTENNFISIQWTGVSSWGIYTDSHLKGIKQIT